MNALMQFFEYAHLPAYLQQVAEPFAALARVVDGGLPDNPEKDACLRKMVEAKDCAVRARLFKP